MTLFWTLALLGWLLSVAGPAITLVSAFALLRWAFAALARRSH